MSSEPIQVKLTFKLWKQWKDGVAPGAIAKELGVEVSEVRRAAKAFDFPKRMRKSHGLYEIGAPMPPYVAVRCTSRSRQQHRIRSAVLGPKHPEEPSAFDARWTASDDAKILKTGGKYKALSAAAFKIGRPLQSVRQRWHQLQASQ